MFKKSITTSRQQLLALCIAAGFALFAASCNNDELSKGNNPTPPQEEQKKDSMIVDLGGLKFGISETPFGADTEEEDTRAVAELTRPDTIDLGNGVEAEVSIEPEKLPATRAIKHGLSDGNYRIWAYQGNVNKGAANFTVTGGHLSYVEKMVLPAGTYDFFCCNQYVAALNNSFVIPHSNVAGALIGFAMGVQIQDEGNTYIGLAMTHAGSRIRTKISAMMPLPADMQTKLTLATGVQQQDIKYNILTRDYEYAPAHVPTNFPVQSYTAQADVYNAVLGVKLKTSLSNDYTYFISHFPTSGFNINFLNGSTLYKKAMNSFPARRFTKAGTLSVNRSYVINIKFIPQFKYLFQDGSVDYLRNKGTRTPIALALTDHLGMALTDAAPPNYPTHFIPNWVESSQPTNSATTQIFGIWSRTFDKGFPSSVFMQDNPERYAWWEFAITHTTNGAFYTWDPDGSTGYRGNGLSPATGIAKIKGNNINQFPAFYWSDLHRKALIKKFTDAGIAYNANILAQRKWFLPSVGEWMWVLDGVCMGNHTAFVKPSGAQSAYTTSYNQIINYALTKAGGTPLWNASGTGYHYWTCVEWDNYDVGGGINCDFAYTIVVNNDERFYFGAERKGCNGAEAQKYRVRSFVNF